MFSLTLTMRATCGVCVRLTQMMEMQEFLFLSCSTNENQCSSAAGTENIDGQKKDWQHMSKTKDTCLCPFCSLFCKCNTFETQCHSLTLAISKIHQTLHDVNLVMEIKMGNCILIRVCHVTQHCKSKALTK